MGSTALAQKPAPISLLQRIALGLGRLFGWRVQIDVPIPDKCVIIGAHHTSRVDFFVNLLLIFGGGVRMRWLAKDSLFRPPFGVVMRALGALPVDRSQSNNLVHQMVDAFAQADQLRLGILPEGTRQYRTYWKTGFYHIASGAHVPILLGYADFSRKVVGIGGALLPAGSIARDFELLRRFYADIRGRHPHLHGIVALREGERAGKRVPSGGPDSPVTD